MRLILLFILTWNIYACDIKRNLFTLYQNKSANYVLSKVFNDNTGDKLSYKLCLEEYYG